MIKVNLLPYREKKKEVQSKNQVVILGAAGLAFVVLLGAFHIYTVMKLSGLENQVQSTQQTLQQLKTSIGDINQYKKAKEILEKRLSIINYLEKNRFAKVLFLDDLTSMVPVNQVWIKSMKESETDVKIDGFAKDNIAIAKFMRNLEKSEQLTSVDLVSSKQTEIAGNRLKQFTLSCGLKKGF
ncbi:MAG TPA: PilN domain-containing protein [Syntrophales bacterium]|nr:PilN domain-containing protein [Syntrophales bacterium]